MGVSTSAIVDASVQDVWRVVSDFPNLMAWHPLVSRCETSGEGEGAVRKVYIDDWWVAERLNRLDHEQHEFAYEIIDGSRPSIIGMRGSIKLTPEGEAKTRVDWTSGLEDENPFAEAVNAGLAAYYPTRIGNLKAALGLSS